LEIQRAKKDDRLQYIFRTDYLLLLVCLHQWQGKVVSVRKL
jgi:hypothetical protein